MKPKVTFGHRRIEDRPLFRVRPPRRRWYDRVPTIVFELGTLAAMIFVAGIVALAAMSLAIATFGWLSTLY